MDALKPRERLLGPALRTQPDRRLVALARDGSTPAQEEIVRRYRAALVRFAGSIVGPAAAEDVVQEALTKGLAALGDAGEELRLRPWLYAIVRNTALNHLRDAGPATEQIDENYDGVEQPPQALERREQVRSLVGGLRRLPRQQREALVKRELEGRSHDEIAAELGVSSGAARQLIFRAREGLRVGLGSLLPMPVLRWLAESGGGDAAVGVAAGAGGGALAAKAAVAVFAAGAAVTAGVAIDHGARPQSGPLEAAVRPAVALPGAGGAAAALPGPVAPAFAAEESSSATGDGSGRGSGSSGPGSGGEREDGDDHGGGGPGPSEHSGPGRGDEANVEEIDFDQDDSGGHSGRGGPGRSGGEDRSGSSHSGTGSGSSGKGGGDGSHSGSGGSDRGGNSGSSGEGGESKGSTSGGSGSGGGGSGSSHSGSSGGGGGSGGDNTEVATAPTPTPTPPPAPEPVEESSSGSGSSGGGEFAEDARDLSSGGVSQGSDDPD